MEVRAAGLPADRVVIDELLGRVAIRDGFGALSEESLVVLDSTHGSAGWLAEYDGRAIGFAHRREHRAASVVEVAVEGTEAGSAARALVQEVLRSEEGPVRLWTTDPAAAACAVDGGLSPGRCLLRMERSLPADAAAEIEGVRVTPYRPGLDEGAYLIVANDAFSAHPESSRWTRETFDRRAARPWFDSVGLFLAWERGRPVGTCWTKLHPGGVGEIYSIAVRPSAGGRGIGKALVLRGFDHLHRVRRASVGMLWADRANEAAVRLYGRLGMQPVRERSEFLAGF